MPPISWWLEFKHNLNKIACVFDIFRTLQPVTRLEIFCVITDVFNGCLIPNATTRHIAVYCITRTQSDKTKNTTQGGAIFFSGRSRLGSLDSACGAFLTVRLHVVWLTYSLSNCASLVLTQPDTRKNKTPHKVVPYFFLVGVTGFEPATSTSRT